MLARRAAVVEDPTGVAGRRRRTGGEADAERYGGLRHRLPLPFPAIGRNEPADSHAIGAVAHIENTVAAPGRLRSLIGLPIETDSRTVRLTKRLKRAVKAIVETKAPFVAVCARMRAN